MLNVQLGDMPDAIYNTSEYFKNAYLPAWITDPLSVEMIRDVDNSEVMGENIIQSPVLGSIPPTLLSGGVKTLILLAHDKSHVFNISTCGDNCAKWILKIAQEREDQKRKLLTNLRHLMDFGDGPYRIRVLDPNGKNLGIATNRAEFLNLVGKYV